jgi:glucokinase
VEAPYIVVDLGGTHIRCAVASGPSQLTGKIDEPTSLDLGPGGVIQQIAALARRSLQMTGVEPSNARGLVIGSPGPLDARTGVVFSPPNLPGWDHVALGQDLGTELGLPVRVVNDANAAALGEFHFGAGRNCRNFVYVTVSTGIGAGVVADSHLVEGTSGTAGEIGHMTIDYDGIPCTCGSIGCLEMLASGTAIARLYRERLTSDRVDSSLGGVRGNTLSAAEIARLAREGDVLAGAVYADAARALGFGMVNLINLFNPDVIAVGGGVTQAGSLIFDGMITIVNRHAYAVPRAAVKIVAAELGEEVGLIGVAAVAFLGPEALLAENH